MSKHPKNHLRGIIGAFIMMGHVLVPAFLFGASAIVSWTANQESDLAGYEVHYGTSPGVYTMIVDVGNVTQKEITNLTIGQTYYFAVTAYDNNANVSEYSEEKSHKAQDGIPPTLVLTKILDAGRVKLIFSEPVYEASAEQVGNYSINNGIVIQNAELQPDLVSVVLYTTQHANNTYTITINNVTDLAEIPNVIASNTTGTYTWDKTDETKPTVSSVELVGLNLVKVNFSEPVEQVSAKTLTNYQIPGITIYSASMTDDFMSVQLTTSDHVPGSSYSITIRNVQDKSLNVMDTAQKSYQAPSANTAAPTVISVIAISSTQVEVQFSETVSSVTAQNKNNYSIEPGITVYGAILSTDKRTVTLSTSTHSTGNYTMTVSGVQDEGLPALTMSGIQKPYTFTEPDHTKPQLLDVEITNSYYLAVKFDELLDGNTATNKDNFTISPSVNIINASLDNTTGKNIFLTTGEHSANNYTLTVKNVRDVAQNVMVTSTKSYSYTPPDNTPPVLTGATIDGTKLVRLVFNEELDRSSAQTTANYAISPAVTITQADLSNNIVYLSTSDHQSGQKYTITVNGVKDKALNMIQTGGNTQTYTAPILDNTPPVLSGVEVLGTKYIALSFSESLDEASAVSTNNYTIPGISVTNAELDFSKRKVTLNTSDHQAGIEYTVVVQNIKDLAGNIVGPNEKKTYQMPAAEDKQPPAIKGDPEILGDKLVVISFNEPLDPTSATDKSNYSINQGIIVEKISLRESNQAVYLETSVHLRGLYEMTIKNIKDMSNNTMATRTVSYSYSPIDDEPPTLVRADALSQTSIQLTFNEVLDRVSAENISNYTVMNSITQEKLEVTYASWNNSGYGVLLITSEQIPGTYKVIAKGIKDGNGGNESPDDLSIIYSYAKPDNTPPVIENVFLNSSTQLVVQYNELMENTSISQKSNYIINNGIVVKSAFANSEGDVILETSEHVAGNYKLTVNGVCDVSSNPIQAYSQKDYDWNPNDTTPPEVESATLISASYLILKFTESINAEDASNPANYTTSLEIQKVNLDADFKTVFILFKENHEPGIYSITVNNIRDRAFVPNTIKNNNTKTYTFSSQDTEPPKLLSATAKSPYRVDLLFDEKLSSEAAIVKSNYSITPNVSITGANITNDRRTVILETGVHDGTIKYTIKVQNLEDTAPVPNKMNTPQEATYFYNVVDNVKPVLMSAKLQNYDNLELIFSEQVEKASAENRNNYQISPGVEIGNAILDPSNPRRVTLETSQHIPGFTYTIQIRNVRDMADIPNVIDQNTSKTYDLGTLQANNQLNPLKVARIEPVSATKIDVVFNQPVDKATAENKTNYSINEGAIEVQAAVIDTNFVRVHLATAAHAMNQSYSIRVFGIKDRSTSTKTLAVTPGIQYILTQGLAISGVSQSDYRLAAFSQSASSYVDRDYSVVKSPDYLTESLRVVTANDDKTATDESFLTFELKGSAKVLIAYDTRIDSIPVWLSSWEANGDKIVDSRDNVFNVYEAYWPEGKVTLGGNFGTMDDAMYLVYAIPQKASGTLISGLNKSSYQTAFLKLGDAIYIDREYTLAEVPKSLDGLMWLKTANDDKTSTETNFLCFDISDSSQIYIAYDERIASLPKWLNDWETCKDQVVDSRGTRYDLFTQSFSEGKVTLGGNCGSIDDNMYLVAIQSFATDNYWSKMPGFFTLGQNYPNPFNPVTNIKYTVHKPGQVLVAIYNVLGQQVKVLVNRELNPGEYSDQWDATDDRGIAVSSGVYFYRIQVGDFAKTKRMMLLR